MRLCKKADGIKRKNKAKRHQGPSIPFWRHSNAFLMFFRTVAHLWTHNRQIPHDPAQIIPMAMQKLINPPMNFSKQQPAFACCFFC